MFECIYKPFVNETPIPVYVFPRVWAFARVALLRFLTKMAMDGTAGAWGRQTAVPDITKTEAKMWFYYRHKVQ